MTLAATTAVDIAICASERKALIPLHDAQRVLQLPLARAARPQIVETRRDFTAELPIHTDVPAVLSVLQRSCAAAGVTMQEVRVEERRPSVRELGLAQLTLQLRGTYPNIKQVLIDAQDHFAALTVRRLDLHRRMTPAVEAEGTVTLAIWARPLTLPPALSAADVPVHRGS